MKQRMLGRVAAEMLAVLFCKMTVFKLKCADASLQPQTTFFPGWLTVQIQVWLFLLRRKYLAVKRVSLHKDWCEETQDLPRIAEICFLMSLGYSVS